ncbi:MAG: DUF368 domain-containing protein [Oscillospiraceae bacterium]|nr:DUF368 domain-containing protein [Oscillospiraceae bacterium]
MQHIINALKGIVIGISNVIPGVSGGTMAIIMNIYDKMISIASLNILFIKKNIKFIIAFVIGLAVGVLGFSFIINFLFENFNMQTNFFFIGIVLGSIPMILKRADVKKLKPSLIISFILAFAIIIALSFISTDNVTNTVATTMSVGLFIRLLISCALASFSMIIPGISGSFILLVLGSYDTVIGAISNLISSLPNIFDGGEALSTFLSSVLILIPAGIGIILGLVLGARLVGFLMKRFPQATYMAILGLIIGSVVELYPGFSFTFGGVVAIICMVIGGAVSYIFGRSDIKQQNVEKI